QVAQGALYLGEGESKGPCGGAGILVLLSHGKGLLASRSHASREGESQETPGRQANPLAQAHDGVQYGTGSPGQGAAVECHGTGGVATPPQEPGPIGLPL